MGPAACRCHCVGLAVGLGISPPSAEPSAKDVLKTYADIAQAGYTDSLDTANTPQARD